MVDIIDKEKDRQRYIDLAVLWAIVSFLPAWTLNFLNKYLLEVVYLQANACISAWYKHTKLMRRFPDIRLILDRYFGLNDGSYVPQVDSYIPDAHTLNTNSVEHEMTVT